MISLLAENHTFPVRNSEAIDVQIEWCPLQWPGPLRGSRIFLLLAAVIGLVGCRSDRSLQRPAFASGDSLFDFFSLSKVERYPSTNLPPDIAARIQKPFLTVRNIRASEWINAGNLLQLQQYREQLGGRRDIRWWRMQPHLPLATDAGPPEVLVSGQKTAPWDQSSGPFPRKYAWYNEDEGSLYALSKAKPEKISIEFWADPVKELGRHEKVILPVEAASQSGVATAEFPHPQSLVQREEFDGVSRPCLLLPAPGSLSVAFESFPAEELQVAVAVADHGYRLEGNRLHPVPGASDGVRFSVEVDVDDRTDRVWELSMKREEVGKGFQEATIDLQNYRGRKIKLRLVSGAGIAGDTSYDYALWSDLRLLATPQRNPDRPHVVIIDVDTLRADRLGSYGYERPTTTRLDAWAASEAVVFRDTLATSSWTPPSTSSILTGLAPHQHLMYGHEGRLTTDTPTLAMMLSAADYDAYSFVEGAFFGRAFGLDLGFHINDSNGGREWVASRWAEVIDRIRSRRSERPFFLLLQTYLGHLPYELDRRFDNPAEPYEGQLAGKAVDYDKVAYPYSRGDLELTPSDKDYVNALYDAGVARMDEIVGVALESLNAALADQDVLVIFTSDHGEEFWEHGSMNHGQSLYGELLRVPLIVQFPSEGGSRRVGVSDLPASLLDIVPTVLDYAGVEVPANLPGRSLRTALPRERVRVAQLSESYMAVQFAQHKLLVGAPSSHRWKAPPTQLYHLDEDPHELNNVAAVEPEVVEELKRRLRNYLESYPSVERSQEAKSHIGPDELKELRALGYVQ